MCGATCFTDTGQVAPKPDDSPGCNSSTPRIAAPISYETDIPVNPTILYRIAAVLLILFAVGHTLGFLSFKPASAEGQAVREAMNSVQFDFKGSSYSYGGFYRGFGLMVSAYLLFSAFLAWHLSGLAAAHAASIGWLGWMFVAAQLACLVLSVMYFFLVPALISGAVVVCLAWAAWLAQSG